MPSDRREQNVSFPHAELGLAGIPPRCDEFNRRPFIPNVAYHATDKPVMLTKELKRFEDLFINEAEIRSPSWI